LADPAVAIEYADANEELLEHATLSMENALMADGYMKRARRCAVHLAAVGPQSRTALAARESHWIDCKGRAAVVIEPVSVNSLRKMGIFRE
jgi:hypothetical protein